MRDTITSDNDKLDQRTPGSESEPIRSLDLLYLLVVRRRFILLITLLFFVLGVLFTLMLKPNFTATAIILPPQQQQSSLSAVLGQLGSLGSLAGASSLGLKSPSDMYVGFLKSNSIGDQIIQKFHLADVYKSKSMQDLRKLLASHSDIEAAKDGLIHITVTDHDPNRASELANSYVDGLYKLNSTVAITEAAQRRVFFDQQLQEEKKALADSEDDLRSTQQKTGIIQLGGQAEELIRSVAQMRAEIASREVELQSLRTFATDNNPDVTRQQQELAALRNQLSKLQNDQQSQLSPGDITVPAGRVPEQSLEYARKLREVKYHDSLYALLARQREAARIDEARSAPIIQVIDRAMPPDKKSGPSRLLIVVGFTAVGLLLASSWLLLTAAVARMRQDPVTAGKLDNIATAMHRKRVRS